MPALRAAERGADVVAIEPVASPVRFDMIASVSGPGPGFAEQTTELGLDRDRITELKTVGAVT